MPFDFISLSLFALTFAMKLKDANYKNHWNILVFSDQWKMMSDLNMSHGKMSDFVVFPLFGFTLVIKLRLWKPLKNLIFFDEKNRYEYVCETVSNLVEDLLIEERFGNKVRNSYVKLYWTLKKKRFNIFQLRNWLSYQNLLRIFSYYLYF